MTSAPLRLSRVSTAIAVVFALAAAPAAAAGYLKFGDIKGDVQARAGHGREIHIESFSWGATQAGAPFNYGGGGSTGKVNVHDVSMSRAAAGTASKDMTTKGSTVGENSAAGDPDRPLVAGRVPNTMKESGEKGGTEDINIGVGELQEMTISKSSDKATPKLYESAAKGKVFKSPAPKGSMSTVVPAGACRLGARYPTAELGTGDRVYTMTGVVVTGCSTAASHDGSIPTETLSLNYDKITWK